MNTNKFNPRETREDTPTQDPQLPATMMMVRSAKLVMRMASRCSSRLIESASIRTQTWTLVKIFLTQIETDRPTKNILTKTARMLTALQDCQAPAPRDQIRSRTILYKTSKSLISTIINTMIPRMITEIILCLDPMPLSKFHHKCIKLWVRIQTLETEKTEVELIWTISPTTRTKICKKTSEMSQKAIQITIQDRWTSPWTTMPILRPFHRLSTTRIANTDIPKTM